MEFDVLQLNVHSVHMMYGDMYTAKVFFNL